jgi:hypothetical protein
MDKWRVDEFYDHTILAFSRFLGRFCAGFDKHVVDGVFTELTSQTIRASSYVFTRMQNGLVHAYGTVMAVGLLAIAFHFIVPHPKPVVAGDQKGLTVELEASKGLSYQYRWDFDGDGTFDTEWAAQPKATHQYAERDFKRFAVVLEGASYGARPETIVIASGQALKLSESDLGPNWQNAKDGTLPSVIVDPHGLVLKPNGARVRKDGAIQLADADVHVGVGEHIQVGDARLSLTGFVEPRLQVRNAFGMQRVGQLELVVPAVAPRITAQVAALNGRPVTPVTPVTPVIGGVQ